MSFSNLSSAQIRHLIALVRKKEALQARLDRVTQMIDGLEGGEAPKRRGRRPKAELAASKPGRPGRKTRKRGKRLKEPLLQALKSAGSGGMTVKDLAAKLKVKPGNIFSWFYTTGKKVKGLSKVGEAKYAYSA
jgi:hypothetical protein